MNNILHYPSKELKERIDDYKIIHNSESRLTTEKNKKLFEEELQKVAWIKVTSNAIISSVDDSLRYDIRQAGYRPQKTLKIKGVSNKKIQNYTSITNIAKNNNNSRISGGFKELYSQIDSNYKFRPNAYIEGLSIEYTGDLGSIIKGNLEIVCSNVEDFEIVNELYANPSVSLVVEWGYNTNNALKHLIKDHKVLWEKSNKNYSTYERLIKKSKGDYGASLMRVTNINFAIDESGFYKITLGLMSRGVSEMFADDKKTNGKFSKSKALLIKYLSSYLNDEDDDIKEDEREQIHSLQTKIYKQIKKNENKSDIILINKKHTRLKYLLSFINIIFKDNIINPHDIFVEWNNFLITKNFNKINMLLTNTFTQTIIKSSNANKKELGEYYSSKNETTDSEGIIELINVDSNDLKLKIPIINIENIWINVEDTKRLVEKATSMRGLLTSILKFITDNIICDFELKLELADSTAEYAWNITTNKVIETISEGKPLNIPVFGKNSIVSSFDVSGGLTEGLAQTVLYSKAEELDKTVGNIWSVKNDKYINYLRKSNYEASDLGIDDISNDNKDFTETMHKYIQDNGIENVMNNSYFKFSQDRINELTNAYKWLNSRMRDKDDGQELAGRNLRAIYPLETSIKFLFGNTLFTYGTLFSMNYLPERYKYDFNQIGGNIQPCFYSTNISHEFSGFNWKTSIKGNLTLI